MKLRKTSNEYIKKEDKRLVLGLLIIARTGLLQEGVIRSMRKRDDTISQLYDATQTSTLHP